MGYIYKITNNVNGKIYIGKTINLEDRWYKHKYLAMKGINRHLYSAMRKYGIDNFSFEVIEQCDDNILNDREKYWIDTLASCDRNIGYNKTIGGDSGDTWTYNNHQEQTSKLLSEKLKGKKHDPDSYRRAGEKRRGYKMNDEQRKKISDSLKNGHITGRIKSVPPPHYDRTGEHQPDSAKRKLSEYRAGKTYDEIYSREISDRLKEQRRQMWTGSGNPNYIDINVCDIIKLIKDGYQNKQIAEMFNVRPQTIWYKLKANGLSASDIRANERNCI